MNTAPTPSRSAYVQSLHLFTIIIDQTTLKDDLSLIVCQLTQSYLELLQSITFNGIAFDHVCFFLNRLADSREEQIITVLERKISGRDQEWKHTPVDQIGTIPLGCILIGNVCKMSKLVADGQIESRKL